MNPPRTCFVLHQYCYLWTLTTPSSPDLILTVPLTRFFYFNKAHWSKKIWWTQMFWQLTSITLKNIIPFNQQHMCIFLNQFYFEMELILDYFKMEMKGCWPGFHRGHHCLFNAAFCCSSFWCFSFCLYVCSNLYIKVCSHNFN